jgi:DNA-directed RNA polymerase subunit RPC12/RpoP|tara:strand:- start:1361 stop:1612 length:252 start_codon:yes stop_codon:yes gene_type:complete
MVLKIAFAVAVAMFIFRLGLAVLKMLATPIPEPPPAGELRKVKLQYRCSLCGTEVRMTVAPDEAPVPPRHCMDDMELQQTEDL